MLWAEEKKRKPFSMKTKKIEWMIASGRKVYDKSGKLRFVKTSKCRECDTPLRWGDRTYNFDHKDNNPMNNSQTNCYLVCRNCHGKHTVIKKRKIKGWFGETIGHKTIKKKVGYKKPKKKPTTKETKRIAVRNFFGNVVGYRTVKVRQPKKTKKKTTARKKTKPKTTKTRRRRKKK